jgi:hypothetical protein
MPPIEADQDPGFDAALSAGVGMTGRRVYRPLTEQMRARLVPGERVADVAPTYGGMTVGATPRPNDSHRLSRSLLIVVPFVVVVAAPDKVWPVVLAALSAALILSGWRRQRRRPLSGGWRALVMVTDRRLIMFVYPDDFRELALESVKDVQVQRSGIGVVKVRLSQDAGSTDINVISEWPKRRAMPAAEAIAADIRRAA